MITGVALATQMLDPELPQLVLVTGAAILAASLAWRGMPWRWQVVAVCSVWGLTGLAAASWQLACAPVTLETGVTTSLAELPSGNFLLWIDREFVTARAADGQYFRINPVSRP